MLLAILVPTMMVLHVVQRNVLGLNNWVLSKFGEQYFY